MNNNTHSAHIIGPEFSAFVDGIPDTCDHKWDGDLVMVAQSGKVILWHTYRQWAHLTTQARYQLVMEYHNSIEDPILECGVSCSKCRKPFKPNL